MVSGILVEWNQHCKSEVYSISGEDTPEKRIELRQKIQDLRNAPQSSRISWYDFKRDDMDNPRWSVTIREEGKHSYQLCLDSMFSPSIKTLLDYVQPHFLEPRYDRDGYISSWFQKRQGSSDIDLLFTAFNTRGDDDGIGGFANQILFKIEKVRSANTRHEFLECAIYVLCQNEAWGSDDSWENRDSFIPHKVLGALIEHMRLGDFWWYSL